MANGHLQLQDARHGEKQDHEVRDHICDPSDDKHSIAVPACAAFDGRVPVESQRATEKEGLKHDRDHPHYHRRGGHPHAPGDPGARRKDPAVEAQDGQLDKHEREPVEGLEREDELQGQDDVRHVDVAYVPPRSAVDDACPLDPQRDICQEEGCCDAVFLLAEALVSNVEGIYAAYAAQQRHYSEDSRDD